MKTIVVMIIGLLLASCGGAHEQAKTTAATAAEIVNALALGGEQVYAVSVEACDTAENAAAHVPDLDQAHELVRQIRARCDQAFAAAEDLRLAIEKLDSLADTATAPELVAAALQVRQLLADTAVTHAQLAKFLERVKR